MTTEQLALQLPGRRIRRTPPGMREDDLLNAVRKLARLTGWRMFHCFDSRKSIGPGFPDVVLAHARQQRTIFAELKSPTGRLSIEQEAWLITLAEAGNEVAVWRPTDLPEIAVILRGGRRIDGLRTIELECEASTRDQSIVRARENRRAP